MSKINGSVRRYLAVPGAKVQIVFAVLGWVLVLIWPSAVEAWATALAWTTGVLGAVITYAISAAGHRIRFERATNPARVRG
jgi:hypothetical protein